VARPAHGGGVCTGDRGRRIRADRDNFRWTPELFDYARGQPGWQPLDYRIANQLDLGRPLDSSSGGGTVKSAKPEGEGVRVEFKSERYLDTKVDCRTTNRIHAVSDLGNIYYEQDCKILGKEWVTTTADPVWVPADYAGALKPGVFALVWRGGQEQSGAAVAIPGQIWANKDRTKLLGVLGFPL